MIKENWIIKGIMLFGTDPNPKVCDYCERTNHTKNTHCWYCNKRFVEFKDYRKRTEGR